MLRIVFSLIVSATVARWVYQEAEIVAPLIVPAMDFVSDITEIPTHDKWPKSSMDSLFQCIDVVGRKALAEFAGAEHPEKARTSPRKT